LLPLIFEPWGRLLLARLGLQAGQAVLDVATGPGTLARQAAALVGPTGKVTGADMSPPMLAQAKAQPPVPGGAPLEYVEASALQLPFADASFDAVTCQQGLQFFGDQPKALAEMKRVLKPGGKAAIAMWADGRAMTPFVAVHDALELATEQKSFMKALAWLSPEALQSLLEKAGFASAKAEEVSLPTRFEGGFPQVLACALGTSAGAQIRALTPQQRTRYEEALGDALLPYAKGAVIEVPVRAVVAVATA
jgi:ubiquinone/menaquinone biosynthesis C-methylase UbiE